ncbi:MAG: hypothetical protein MI861_11025, partial [Pirellulales bacterium]|nr:hypothetical protein [Pirellulales bacterium]
MKRPGKKILLVCLLPIVMVAWGTWFLYADDNPTASPNVALDETEVLMRAKLTSSQKVLEGLLADD